MGVLLAVATTPVPGGDTVGTTATSLGREWAACALEGRALKPAWRRQTSTGRATDGPSLERAEPAVADLPVVVPRLQVPTAQPAGEPHPDRPGSVPRSVRVAVIDSGVQADHPDVGAVRPGLDLLNPCGDGRQDVTGHGTMVAGVMSSATYGASPRVDVLPVRISLDNGRHLSWASAVAVVYATNKGADIINMSYANQGRGASVVERAALRYAASRGVALVAAAGNDPDRPAGYPAAYPETLSVTSINSDGELSRFAARRGAIDVAASGSRVLTLWPDGSVRVASGTSMAAPVVSAAIAQLLLTDPSLSGAEAVELLRSFTSAPRYPKLAPRFGALDVPGALTALCHTIGGCVEEPVGDGGDRSLQPR
jgi:subtilisin family serine protease